MIDIPQSEEAPGGIVGHELFDCDDLMAEEPLLEEFQDNLIDELIAVEEGGNGGDGGYPTGNLKVVCYNFSTSLHSFH